MQEHIKTLYSDSISKDKSSQRTDKVLTELRDLSALQQNIIFALGKSMQHMADTIFVQAANFTLLCRDSYQEHLKLGVKPTLGVPLETTLFNTLLSSLTRKQRRILILPKLKWICDPPPPPTRFEFR